MPLPSWFWDEPLPSSPPLPPPLRRLDPGPEEIDPTAPETWRWKKGQNGPPDYWWFRVRGDQTARLSLYIDKNSQPLIFERAEAFRDRGGIPRKSLKLYALGIYFYSDQKKMEVALPGFIPLTKPTLNMIEKVYTQDPIELADILISKATGRFGRYTVKSVKGRRVDLPKWTLLQHHMDVIAEKLYEGWQP